MVRLAERREQAVDAVGAKIKRQNNADRQQVARFVGDDIGNGLVHDAPYLRWDDFVEIIEQIILKTVDGNIRNQCEGKQQQREQSREKAKCHRRRSFGYKTLHQPF